MKELLSYSQVLIKMKWVKKVFPIRAGAFLAVSAAEPNSLAPGSAWGWPHRLFLQLCCRSWSFPRGDYNEQLGWAASLATVCCQSDCVTVP